MNGYADLYSSNSYRTPVFEEMISIDKTVNPINTYSVVPPSVSLVITPTKVLKKCRKKRIRKKLATIKRAQSDTKAPSGLLSNALH